MFCFISTCKTEIYNKISEIKRSGSFGEGLSKRLLLPYTGKNVHLQSFWMMEFRDEEGVRRFFRMEYQAPKANIDTRRFVQSKLDPNNEEEAAQIRGLQKFINIKLEKQRKRNGRRGEDNEKKRKRH